MPRADRTRSPEIDVYYGFIAEQFDYVTLTLFGVQKLYFWRVKDRPQVELADSATLERKKRPILRM